MGGCRWHLSATELLQGHSSASVSQLLLDAGQLQQHICTLALHACCARGCCVLMAPPGPCAPAAADDHMLRAAGGKPGRYMQCFMYVRSCPEDNHYAHPLDLVVVLDMNTKQVIPCCIIGLPASAGCTASAGCATGAVRHAKLCLAGVHVSRAGQAPSAVARFPPAMLYGVLGSTADCTADALPPAFHFQQSCSRVCPVQVLEFIHHDGPPPALPPLNSNFHAKLVEQERGFR